MRQVLHHMLKGLTPDSILSKALISIAIVAILMAPVSSHAQGTDIIQSIAVEGSARVDAETIRSYLGVREGDLFDLSRIDASLKTLFATGLFADVQLYQDGSILVVRVVENPVINRIAFEGNLRIKDEELMTEVSLKPRVIYTRSKVQNDASRIQNLYQKKGRYSVTVEPKLIQLPQNRVDLVFEIMEGTLTEVQNIRFIGNQKFDDEDLQEVVRTRQTRWYRFLSQDDRYDPDRITFDRELLRRFYLEEGYADFQVLSALAELTNDRSKFFITFTVEEGKRYKFGEISLDANLRNLKNEDLQGSLEIPAGGWYDASIIDLAVDSITDRVGDFGYAFVDVRPKIKRNRETGIIDVVFEITEGPRVFVDRINVTGNVRTLDKVIRREFQLVEGDAFNAAKIRASIRRIENLNFFNRVDVRQNEGSAPDKAVVSVNVEEKSTGSLSIGAGYSTSYGPMAEFSISESNLLGRGQYLSLSTRLSGKQSTIDLKFTEPYFLEREIAAGFDLFHTTTDLQNSSSYDSEETGFGLRAGFPISPDLYQHWGYTIKSSSIYDVKTTASSLIQSQAGKSMLSILKHSLTYDLRNSKINPTDGYLVRMNNDLAGIGGDSHYLRNAVIGRSYHEIADDWVVSVKGKAGMIIGIGEDVNLRDRFFLGGDNLRGFTTSGVGPRDSSTEDALGGELTYSGSLELSVPLGLPEELGISGKIFSDFGAVTSVQPKTVNVVDSASVRASAGVGISWRSPMGPISIDFAQAIIKESYDQTEIMRINFGTKF